MTRLVLTGPGGVLKRYPYQMSDLRADNPDTSFPEEIAPDTLADFGVFEVLSSPLPEAGRLERVVEIDPVFKGGCWRQAFAVERLDTNEARAQLAAEIEARRAQACAEPGAVMEHEIGPVRIDANARAALGDMALTALLEQLAGASFEGHVELADGRSVRLSGPEILTLRADVGRHVAAIEAHARVLHTAIGSAPSHKARASIDIEQGWPEANAR